MQYKLSKIKSDEPLAKQGFIYRVVQCNDAEEKAIKEIHSLVIISRASLKRIYSGTLSEEQFDADLKTLKDNDTRIQKLAKIAGIEYAYLDPFANGRGFVED